MSRANSAENPAPHCSLINIFRILLPSLSIEAILHEPTINLRQERLKKVTDRLGLEEAYGAVIERIKAQDENESRLGMKALMWVSHVERPLTADELCLALAIEPGSTDFNVDSVPSILTLLGCCQGLITMDKDPSTVRLIHSTFQEYLSARPDIFIRPHSAIAEICLTYLNSEKVKALSRNPSPDTKGTPFLEYCSLSWGIHAKRELSDRSRSLALQMFQEYDSHVSVKLLLRQLEYIRFRYVKDDSKFNGLDCASFFGIKELATAVTEMRCYDINEGHLWGYTPLIWAAHNGHEEVVKILLDARASPDKKDEDGETPLTHAARNGHAGVVKILLERDEVNSNHEGRLDPPLMSAAKNGHEGVVKELLRLQAVCPDKPSGAYGRTPLSYAAERGYDGVVERLLEREEVNPDQVDSSGRTPLSYAACGGREGVVKILIRQEGVNPDKPSYGSQTPLSYAAQKGHEGVVKILLEQKEVNPDQPDSHDKTPLGHAALEGYLGVVKILLGRGEVNPDAQYRAGQTPLAYAAHRGHEKVVNILLGRAEVNPDKPSTYGRTPLWHAASNGHEGIVKILLGRKEVNPDRQDNEGETPFFIAAERGRDGVVKILLAREDVTPDKPNRYGRTPLEAASAQLHTRVVELLDPKEAVNLKPKVKRPKYHHVVVNNHEDYTYTRGMEHRMLFLRQ